MLRDIWHGFERTISDFEGHRAWIVAPEKPAEGLPWVWVMEWPDAFPERNGVLECLRAGYHFVYLDWVDSRGNDEAMESFRRYYDYLTECRGFAKGVNLIGMSFGGFYSLRFAWKNPDCVRRIYLDAPVCNLNNPRIFHNVQAPFALESLEQGRLLDGIPLNFAAKLTHIPILLIYGKEDLVVPPATNCEEFAARFKAAGGRIEIVVRDMWGHHPHGLEPSETHRILDWFR